MKKKKSGKAGRPSRSKILARLRRARTTAKSKAVAQRAVKRFRAKKSDRLSFVFVSKEGKRIKARGRKGVLVYVTRNGKKVAADKLLHRQERLRNKDQFPVQRSKKKTATKKFFRIKASPLDHKLKGGKIESIMHRSESADYQAMVDSVWRVILGLHKRFRPQQGTWRVNYSLVFSRGSQEGFITLRVPTTKQTIFSQLWSIIAEQLDDEGYVARGSYAYVRSLDENDGVEKDEWTKRGMAWHKSGQSKVTLKRLVYKIERLVRDI